MTIENHNTDLYSARDRQRLTSTITALASHSSEPLMIYGGVATVHRIGQAIRASRLIQVTNRPWGDVQQRVLHDIDVLFRTTDTLERIVKDSGGRFFYVSHYADLDGQYLRAGFGDRETKVLVDTTVTRDGNIGLDATAMTDVNGTQVLMESTEGMLAEVAGYALKRAIAGRLHPKRLRDLHILAEIGDINRANAHLMRRFRLNSVGAIITHLDEFGRDHPERLADPTWESEFDDTFPAVLAGAPTAAIEHSLNEYL